MNTLALKESSKEVIRLAIFAGVSAIVASILQSVTKLPQSTTTIVLTFVLRGADSWIHNNENVKMNGLMPF